MHETRHACSHLQGCAVLFWLFYTKQCAELAKHLRPVEVLIGALVLKLHQELNVLKLLQTELSLHCSLFRLNCLFLFGDLFRDVLSIEVAQLPLELLKVALDLGLTLVFLRQVRLFLFQILLVLGRKLLVTSDFVL